MKRVTELRVLLWLLVCCSPILSAQASNEKALCLQGDSNCRQVGRWEFDLVVGLGVRTNPLAGGDDQPIIVVPQFSWYGEHFFLENFEFGFTLIDKPRHMLNLLLQPGFDHVYFDEISLGNFTFDSSFSSRYTSTGSLVDGPSSDLDPSAPNYGPNFTPDDKSPQPSPAPNIDSSRFSLIDKVSRRHIAILGGLEYNIYLGNWQSQFQALRDIGDVHQGRELRLSSAYSLQQNSNLYTFTAGVVWQSEELLDYYYGIDEGELISNPALAYEVDAGVSGFMKFSWQKKLSERWSLLSTLQYRKLDSSLLASPLVEESGVATAFFGGSYNF